MTEKHHGYTNHGACGIAGQRPKYVARCGGPRLCGTCSLDAERYNESRPDSNEPPTMTDQAPSTEDVRLLNVLTVALADAAQEDDNNFIPFTKRTHYANAIMAHLEEHRAAHDREVAAKALRDAVDELAALNEPEVFVRAGALLDARADRIGAGE